MNDIVERLREGCGCNYPATTCMAESECRDAFDAADEITSLRAENERLHGLNAQYLAALKEIAGLPPQKRGSASYAMVAIARAALEGSNE